MSDYRYFPLIKTRDSELRCFKAITDQQWKSVLPIYELTKSRKTKIAPDGDIAKRMREIGEIQKERPFILDLTTDPKYINYQIEQLLNDENGFLEWQYFLFDIYGNLNIIPVIHLYDGDDFTEVKKFVHDASSRMHGGQLALRLPFDVPVADIEKYLDEITSSLQFGCKLFLILDVGYFRTDIDQKVSMLNAACSSVEKFNSCIEDIVVVSTSFPINPAKEGKNDESGKFEVYEEKLYEEIRREFPYVKYGDYVSINTEQIELKAATFVPRIDILSSDTRVFSYKRYRRADNGYIRCASKVLSECDEYEELAVWANEQIHLAAEGNPTGISPSFWISVRMNYYFERKIRLRMNEEENGTLFLDD